jgi:hypothetical protein
MVMMRASAVLILSGPKDLSAIRVHHNAPQLRFGSGASIAKFVAVFLILRM